MNDPYPTGLWLPHNEREAHFSVPTTEELTAAWLDKHPAALLALPDDIYGVAEAPTVQPTAIVSLDLCEVVRETGLSILRLRGGLLDDMHADGSTGYLDYGSHLNGWEGHDDIDPQAMRQLFAQELMFADQVMPVEFHESIASMLRKWRKQGVYVIANTSTLPGCELSTIDFLNTRYADCCQGILLPRNYDGNGPVTKARALGETLAAISQQTDYDVSAVPVVAIDDALHHAQAYSTSGIRTFVPAYEWNTAASEVTNTERVERHLPGTIDTFIAADRYLAQHL